MMSRSPLTSTPFEFSGMRAVLAPSFGSSAADEPCPLFPQQNTDPVAFTPHVALAASASETIPAMGNGLVLEIGFDATGFGFERSQIIALPSALADDKRRPSEEKLSASTDPVWPLNVR